MLLTILETDKMLQVSVLLLCFLINGVFSQIALESTSEKNKTYEFGFDLITQHRQEMKGNNSRRSTEIPFWRWVLNTDERGIITGEYGFLSADGYYRSIEYTTDDQGRFIILNSKQERVSTRKSNICVYLS